MIRQKITPFLWFDTQAEEAARFYVSLFKDSRITNFTKSGDGGPGPEGTVLTVEFELGGIPFIAMNGGPYFKFNEAISFSVDCADQAEVDHFWEKLSEGGSKGNCGWLKDKFGVSWQIVPSILPRLMADHKRSAPVVQALMKMTKLEIQKLQNAYDGR